MSGCWYALDRLTDVSGVSGTGRVAYARVLDAGVVVLWDTTVEVDGHPQHTRGVEWVPSLEVLTELHCHGGKTLLVGLDWPGVEDQEGMARGQGLLRRAISHLQGALSELDERPA